MEIEVQTHTEIAADHGHPKFNFSALAAGDAGDHVKSFLSELAGAIGGDHVQGRAIGAQSRELYEAVLDKDMEKIKAAFSTLPNPMEAPQRQQWLLQPLSVAGDTAFHIAAYQSYDLLRELLDLSQLSPMPLTAPKSYGTDKEVGEGGGEITMQNVFGNTPLHEAAAAGYLDAVELLCRRCPYLIEMKNRQGETAAFWAAAFGKTHVLEFFVRKIKQRDLENHCIRDSDSISILHVSIVGHHIGLPIDEDNTENMDYDDFSYMSFYGLEAGPNSRFSGYRGSDGDQVQNNLWREHSSKKDINLAAINQSGEKGKAQVVPVQHLLSDGQIEVKIEDDKSKDPQTPLLIATSNGIVEVVEAILTAFPQAIEHTDMETKENILHVTIQHRRREIFSLVKKKKFPMQRLAMRLDKDDNTILHQVACMKFYRFGTRPNPALQLQEELQWFERVKRLMPIHYVMHHNQGGKTAKDLFDETHKEQLEKAQNWTKDTSTSCSTIAALIATVVFAAAYIVPGGTTENGTPNFLHHRLFLVFTIMDIISLTSSLTSLFLFLSILTSPYHMQDFHMSIPRKLMFGFTFLFLSVATAMVAFIVTILLTIQLRKRWTTNLICTTALLPVSMFTLVLRIPLFAGFKDTLRFIRKRFMQFLPRCIITIIKGRKIEKGKLV
ncbi:hypothetical protein Ancab_019872 [Ancistrocladus abbreviatus]